MAHATIASPSGCSEPCSAAAASATTSSSDIGGSAITSVTAGRPTVRVPVLSNKTVSTRSSSSSAAALLTRIPRSAPRPVATMMAVGVARPSAHGQAMTRTATALVRAKRPAGSGPNTHQATKVRAAIPSTIGTKTAATRSARRWIGAREPCASATSVTIRANAVSLPTRAARKMKLPVRLTVPAKTFDSGVFSTGRLSPVSIDSSIVEAPSVTTPSTGIRSPGRMRTKSPTRTSAVGTSTSAPARTTRAVRGARLTSRRIASEVRPRARASSQRPSTTSVMTTALTS